MKPLNQCIYKYNVCTVVEPNLFLGGRLIMFKKVQSSRGNILEISINLH